MLQATRGLVLRATKFSDSSLICRIYTEHFGVRSYIINGVRSPKARVKAGQLRPMSLLNLVVYYREGREVDRIKELSPAYLYQGLPGNVYKGAVGMLMVEVLNKALHEDNPNPELYHFLEDSFVQLDKLSEGLASFHLLFLLRLSKYMGFNPKPPAEEGAYYFDLREGLFLEARPFHPDHLDIKPSGHLRAMALAALGETEKVPVLPASDRKVLLGDLLRYFELHVANFRGIRSHTILDAVFNPRQP